MGAALIHKNKVVIAPEAKDKKGILYSTQQNQFYDSWVAEIELHLGNKKKTIRGGTGLGIFYLRSVDKASHTDSIFGYSNRYEGLGVYLNTILVKNEGKKVLHPI